MNAPVSHPVNGSRATGWMRRAACRGGDPSPFFPNNESPFDRMKRETVAKAICSGCPVRDDCLSYAMCLDVRHGIWGGLTEKDRESKRLEESKQAG